MPFHRLLLTAVVGLALTAAATTTGCARSAEPAQLAVADAAPAAVPMAQNFAPPAAKVPADDVLKDIDVRTHKLADRITELKKQNARDPGLADVEIFHKAAIWIVRHKEFYQDAYAAWTLEALNRGLARAGQLEQSEAPWLLETGKEILRAYRSRVDGSVQPYAVTLPADYGKSLRKKYRLDIVLHGRDSSLTEVKFLHTHGAGKAAPKEQDFIKIDIFGRLNNAYRWAGETDVFEAVENFINVERLLRRDGMLDGNRVVLRGFSMGGAGTWHLGLHHPDRWCVMGPGAGFTVTHGYVKGLPDQLPNYQERCLHIYDAADYAENAANVPIVAYSGSKDPQKDAADQIEKRLKVLGIPMTHLIAPGLAHNFPPDEQKKAEVEYQKYAGEGKGRTVYPNKVRFTTWTLRYPSSYWVEALALDRHYDQARVEVEKVTGGFTVSKIANVRALRLGLPDISLGEQTIKIEGQELSVPPYHARTGDSVYLEKRDGRWKGVSLPQKLFVESLRHLRKTSGLQGPIDDAFMEGGFLCVRGTGKAWHEATAKYATANLQRFADEWNKYFRGDLPIKDDVDLTEEDIAGKHLVLFGDPASNSVLSQVVDGLPVKWTKESIAMGGKTYTAADHVPVMIYPSPLNVSRYVVINSGHTFHDADFRGTNALLFPRLGDYAILKPTPGAKDAAAATVVTAGLFDDSWQLPRE